MERGDDALAAAAAATAASVRIRRDTVLFCVWCILKNLVEEVEWVFGVCWRAYCGEYR